MAIWSWPIIKFNHKKSPFALSGKVPTFLSWIHKIAEGKINHIGELPDLPLLLYTCRLFE